MDRRRFFYGQSLTESLNEKANRYSLEEVFDELNRLYEDADQKDEAHADGESEETKDPNEILNQLKDSDYERFVSILNKDGKSKAFIDYLNNHYKVGDNTIKTIKQSKAQEGTIACSALVPTQQNISLSKSLGMINKGDWAVKIINTPEAAFDDPTITYAGKYIIDGHHRWSKAYALNGGDCKIKVLNFPAIDGVSWEDMLKATQLAIVQANPGVGLVNEVGNDNMLTSSDDDIKTFVIKNICDEVLQAMKNKGRGDSKEAVAETVAKNVANMRSTSQPVDGAAPRSVMPQTDKAPGSLDTLGKAVIDLTESAKVRRSRTNA